MVLTGHTKGIAALAFSADGQWLASGSQDATAGVWHVKLEDLINLACDTAGRNFTQAEWEKFFPGQAYRPTCPRNPPSQGLH